MQAKIIMVIDNEEYVYGTYHFNTFSEKNRVNEIAAKVREERDCFVYVKEVDG